MSINTVADLVDSLPPVTADKPSPKREAKPERHSVTVRKLGMELHNALAIRAMLRECDDPKLILDTIEGETDLAEAIVAVYEETFEDELLVAGLDAKIDELKTRKGRFEKSIELRRTIILMALDRAGIDNVRCPLATLSRSTTKPKLVVDQEEQIPSRFWKPSDPTLDRAKLKAALEAKETVPGARLGEPGVSLTIRVK